MESFPWQSEALCINLHPDIGWLFPVGDGSACASLHGCKEDLGIALVITHSSFREVLMGTGT